MDKGAIFYLVDRLINSDPRTQHDEDTFTYSPTLGISVAWHEEPPLEGKVAEWSNQHPVMWSVGIGGGNFTRTLTRLLLDRTRDLYGPDYVIRVVLHDHDAAAAGGGCDGDPKIAQHWVALQALNKMTRVLEKQKTTPPLLDDESKRLAEELRRLGVEERYYGYRCTLSNNLMAKAFGEDYFNLQSVQQQLERWQSDPSFGRHPWMFVVVTDIRRALRGRRHLLLLENLHTPVSLDVLSYIMDRSGSAGRWLISTTSKDVCHQSNKLAAACTSLSFTDRQYRQNYALDPEYYYHAPPADNDLHNRDWAVLIKEALWDAAGSIRKALKKQGWEWDRKFWLHVAQRCFYYAILYHPLPQQGATWVVRSDEEQLVRCWVAEGLLPSDSDSSRSTRNPTSAGKEDSTSCSSYRSAYQAGKVVIQALQEYSLLPTTYSVDDSTTPTPSAGSTSSDHNKGTNSNDEEGATLATSSQLQEDNCVTTGVSKLATDVPRLLLDQLFSYHESKSSSPLRWVSFMNGDGRHVSWDWRKWKDSKNEEWIPGENKFMTTLVLRACSNIFSSTLPFHKVLNLNRHLRVLDLSYTKIHQLPPSFSYLLNLRLLSLRGCSQLNTLSTPTTVPEEENPPLSHLGNLQVLDMNGVPLLQLTQQDGSNKSNLHYLDLSGSRITGFPPQFFCGMSSLEELILRNCSNLEQLPSSLSELSNLLTLHVEGTRITSFPEDTFKEMQRLQTLKLIDNMLLMSLPGSLSLAKGLKELHVQNCIRLSLQFLSELVSCLEDLYIQTWKGLVDIRIHEHSNLRKFSVSGPWIRYLCLRGCSRLTIVNFSDDLTALEDVDLSGTAIEEVPPNLPNLPQLKKLLLLNVSLFKRFPWHMLVRFPKVFYLDHCTFEDNQMFHQHEILEDEIQKRGVTTNTAKININNSKMFHSFIADAADKLAKREQFLQSFNVQIKPCSSVRGKKLQNKGSNMITDFKRQSPYLDVDPSVAASIMPTMKLEPKQCHVEISSTDQYPNGLRHLLSVTNSIHINDDAFIRCLTDLNYSLMSLEELQLQHCHEMANVLLMNSDGRVKDLSSLKILLASNLRNLLCIVEPSDLLYSRLISLQLLKHIHLEYCPRLEKMFPCSLSLPALETLVILFSSNLKTIFYKELDYEVAPSPLESIKRIYLQELPQLQHIHDDVAFRFDTPNWEKLFVRGCHRFQRLPLLKKECLKSKMVEVNGEREWWDKLQLRLLEQSDDYYLQVSPPLEFASRKTHNIIIRSYLR